jgi:hypothetical protein
MRDNPSMNLYQMAEAGMRRRFGESPIAVWGTDRLTREQHIVVRAKPRPYLLSAIDLLPFLGSRNIVEIGCMRKPMLHAFEEFDPACCNEGHSTRFWASTGHPLWSVDIDQRACEVATQSVVDYPLAKVICGDGIDFLRNFRETIGLLYLDGWDALPGTDYAEKHLFAYREASARLAETSMILIDDTDLLMGGKGKLAIPAAIRDGYELMLIGRQTMLLRQR